MPKICNYNVRSLWSKTSNLSEDINERESDLIFLTEVWEKRENKKHQNKLTEMFEMSGIKYISTPRPGPKRGGGAAIAIRQQKFTLSKLNIPLPSSIEVVWGLLKPKNITGKLSKFIVCCFYSPPRSRKKNILVDHLTLTLQSLLSIHPGAGVIISGDRNDLSIPTLLSIDPSLRQTVQHGTRGDKILDVIITNLCRYYDQPVIVPPLQPDQPGRGAPSDHHGVVATPRSNKSVRITKMKKKIRPLPDSLLRVFRSKLEAQNFHFHTGLEVDQMVDRFTKVTNDLFCEVFPEKTIIVSPEDKPWFNEQLRQIKRCRLREYNKYGRSEKYLRLVAVFNEKFQIEFEKYKEKIKLEVTEGSRGSIYPTIKRLGLRPGESNHEQFRLPAHAAQDLSPAQSAELIAAYFSDISREYSALEIINLPQNIQSFLKINDTNLAPKLTVQAVYSRIAKAKKPRGIIPGDLPKKIVQSCSQALAVPITTVFNQITAQAQYPESWKIEHQIAIPKVSSPETEDDLRNIAKTPFFSKVYESFIGGWLLPIIKPFLDPGQCGLKGLSITHYLIRLLNFVHKTLDMRRPMLF